MKKMSLHSPRPAGIAFPRGSRVRGLTLLELMVALALSLAIITGVVATLVEVLKISKDSERSLDAIGNARAAIETMSIEIKAASRVPGASMFVGENVPLTTGDGMDNDGDGKIDEELPNGIDDDGDWIAADDQHAALGALRERPLMVGKADLGDKAVDEDNKFNLDRLTFRVAAPSASSDFLYENVRYEVTQFEGQDHVLVRHSDKFTASGASQSTTAPLAFNVLSLNFLYWNPNALPKDQYWVETWDSAGPFSSPGFELPASVWAEIVVYADPKDIASYVPGKPVQTQTIRTIINIENVIQDAAFPRSP